MNETETSAIGPDRSPARKRTRLDPTVSSNRVQIIEDWQFNQWGNVTAEDVEIGVSQLAGHSKEHDDGNEYPDFLDLSSTTTNKLREERDKQIAAMLQSTISKETLQRISAGEWEEFMIRKPKRELIFKLNHFQQLSDEVILHIFHWLPKKSLASAALVCQRWHQLAQDESLWTRMDVSSRFLEAGALGHILSRQPIILRLTQSELSTPCIMPGVKAAQPEFRARLLYLDLSMIQISLESLIQLFSKCHRLKKLSLEHLWVNDSVIITLSNNRDLEVLNLAMVEGLTKGGLTHLLTKCCKLKELNLAWTSLCDSSTEYVCSHLPSTLDRLNLSGCRKKLNDENILDLVACCPRLRELDLSDCTGLSGQAIAYITQLNDLSFLALSRCYFIPYQALLGLKAMKSLKYLDVHGAYINPSELQLIQNALGDNVNINKFKFSSVARPTVGPRRSSIWNLRVRD